MHLRRCFILRASIVLLGLSPLLWSQDSSPSGESPCTGSEVVSVPSRPTVSNGTDTTRCGVVEMEYGLERQWPGRGANRDDLAGGLRLGLTPRLDFHWSSAVFLHVKDANAERIGFGDTWLGLKYRFLDQTKRWPSLGVYYQAKVPSASSGKGLGSGEVDHALSVLVSKDVHPVHLDFNITPFFVRPFLWLRIRFQYRLLAVGFDAGCAPPQRTCRGIWFHRSQFQHSGFCFGDGGMHRAD